ncbi:MAG: hypothetical protein NUW23_11185 [Firmicutes bacterium]|jgi:ABC-type sugar transport system permease subunit|nr:hypothetical protein [Bacillota bacterium]
MSDPVFPAVRPKDFGLWLDRRLPVLFVAPVVGILLLLAIGPLLFILITSFTSWELVSAASPQFIWFENYARMFTDSRFWNAVLNTSILLIAGVGLQLLLGLSTALLLNRDFRLKRLVTSVFLIPITIARWSWVSSGASYITSPSGL